MDWPYVDHCNATLHRRGRPRDLQYLLLEPRHVGGPANRKKLNQRATMKSVMSPMYAPDGRMHAPDDTGLRSFGPSFRFWRGSKERGEGRGKVKRTYVDLRLRLYNFM